MTIPLLIYTDAPDHNTGLGRICRDLAGHIHHHLRDVYTVATLGVFGRGSRQFPWTQYFANGPEDAIYNLERICVDFFGVGGRGILLTITPPSWLFALTMPEYIVKEDDKRWKEFHDWITTRKPFEHWAYLAIESHGPLHQFGIQQREIIRRIDRRLYYSRWGAEIAQNSGIAEPDGKIRHIGHGIDTQQWQPAPAEVVRNMRTELGVGPNDLLLGCVATNSRRKLLPLLFEAAYILKLQLGTTRLKLWLNTTVAVGEYNILELAACYGFREGADFKLTSSNARRTDDWLAAMYSACDLTCLPTAGEGFGYPVVESLACGTPCVTGAFGAQSEFLYGFRTDWICPVAASHIITNSTLVEPVFEASQFASRLLIAWTELRTRGTLLREECIARAKYWDWPTIWPYWEKWFLEGAAEFRAKEEGHATSNGSNASSGGKDVSSASAEGSSVGSTIRGDSQPAGLLPIDDNPWRLDRPAPVGVDRETDPS